MISRQQRQQEQREWFMQVLDQDDLLIKDNTHWLRQYRKDARQAVNSLPLLNRKQEAWRYDHIEKLFENNFVQPDESTGGFTNVELYDNLLPPLTSYRLVFINGYYAVSLSNLEELHDGITVCSIGDAIHLMPEKLAYSFIYGHKLHKDKFSALNDAMFNDGVFINIDQGVHLDHPVEIVYLNTNHATSEDDRENLIQTRNIIFLHEGSSVQVIENFVSDQSENNKYFHSNVTEIYLDEGSKLEHYRFQDESRQAYHLSMLYVTQKKNSHYHSASLALGGAWARTEYKVNFEEEQSECDLYGLYAVGDEQLIDFHLDVQHRQPLCRSREQFKGILYGKGTAVFDGRILVDKHAQKSDAVLTNDNLLLVNDAEVNTKPQLEIYADDVKCSHGTTVGRLDKEHLFYLRSRGIAESEARKMLCQGFAEDIMMNIRNEELRLYMVDSLTRTLNAHNVSSGDNYGH
ncbi:MAG: Fe-S cluster assembly protein SufD [Gammaproteobacteria bacterium]|nr:Fe-S cluster assembly protein SufD [Gammaproteobacteria bacterium]